MGMGLVEDCSSGTVMGTTNISLAVVTPQQFLKGDRTHLTVKAISTVFNDICCSP